MAASKKITYVHSRMKKEVTYAAPHPVLEKSKTWRRKDEKPAEGSGGQ